MDLEQALGADVRVRAGIEPQGFEVLHRPVDLRFIVKGVDSLEPHQFLGVMTGGILRLQEGGGKEIIDGEDAGRDQGCPQATHWTGARRANARK